MKKVMLFFILFCSLLMSAGNSLFIEGNIIYDVFINEDTKSKGQLIITQKGDVIKQSMTINGALTSITLYDAIKNESVIYSNSINGKYATRISNTEQSKRNEKFRGATYNHTEETKTIANHLCKKSIINYTDGSSNTVYQAIDLVPGIKELNSMFSEITGIPLQYEIVKGPNSKLVLIAQQVNIQPIDKKELEPLKGYRFLSTAEMSNK
jgi:hypothetical protein